MATEQPAGEEPTIGFLVKEASRDISSLIHQEIQLAKSEVKVSVTAGGIGIGLFVAAGFMAVLAIIMLSIAFAYLINWTGLELRWCYLIVFAAYLLVAGLLAVLGVKKVKQVKAPEKAIEQGKQIPSSFKPTGEAARLDAQRTEALKSGR